MRITITQDDIEQGRRCDPDGCAVARALARAGVKHFGVVGPTVMVLDEEQGTKAVPLPAEVKSWILDFDASRPVRPFSFELSLPEEYVPVRPRSLRPVEEAPLVAA